MSKKFGHVMRGQKSNAVRQVLKINGKIIEGKGKAKEKAVGCG